jgi:hypothetical protein
VETNNFYTYPIGLGIPKISNLSLLGSLMAFIENQISKKGKEKRKKTREEK